MARPSTSAELRAALAAGDDVAVIAAATDLELVEARCRASVDALLDDLAFVLRGAPRPLAVEARLEHVSGARLDRAVVAMLETVLDAARAVLRRDPGQLLPILHDELYWIDAPARAAHGAPSPGDRQLWRWLEHHAEFAARAGAWWLRSLRPPRFAHTALPRWRTPGTIAAVSPDGAWALVARDGLALLELRTGAVRQSFGSGARGRFAPVGDRLVVWRDAAVELLGVAAATPPIALTPTIAPVHDAAFSADGQVLFVAASREVHAYRVADGTRLATLAFAAAGLAPCGDGALLLAGDGCRLWAPARARLVAVPVRCAHPSWTAVSPTGDRVVSYEDGTLTGVALPDGRPLFAVPSQAPRLALHPAGRTFVTTDGRVRDATTGALTGTLPVRDADALAFDPTGRFLCACYWNRVEVVAVDAATVVARVAASRPAVQLSGDGRVLVIDDGATAVIADLAALDPAAGWRDDARGIRSEWMTRFAPSGATVIADHEGGIGFWDVARGVLGRFVAAAHLRGFSATGHQVFAAQDDALIALAAEDGAEVWRATLPGAPAGRLDADVAADDDHGVVLHGHRSAQVVIAFGMDDGRERYRLPGTLALHDRDVALIRDAAGVTLHAIATGAALVTLPGIGDGRLALSPDRRWLALYQHDVTLWDLATGAQRHTWSVEHTFNGFRFRADSAALIVTSYQTQQAGNQDWNAEDVFDVATGRCLGSRGWWDQDAAPDPPDEVAPGIVRDGDQLRVGGVAIPLPDKAIVRVAASGAVYVASTARDRVELAQLVPGRR